MDKVLVHFYYHVLKQCVLRREVTDLDASAVCVAVVDASLLSLVIILEHALFIL